MQHSVAMLANIVKPVRYKNCYTVLAMKKTDDKNGRYVRVLTPAELSRIDRLSQLAVEKYGEIKILELAKDAGIGHGLLGLIFNRKRNLTEENARKIADATGKNFDWLYFGDGGMITSKPMAPLKLVQPRGSERVPQSIPLYGSSSMAFHGKILKSGANQGTTETPPTLDDCPSAYAAYVPDDLMSPRYEPGEIVYCNPLRAPAPGGYVVVEFKAPQAGGQKYGIVRRFVTRTTESLIVETLNPPERQTYPIESIVAIDRIVMSGEG